MVNDAGLHDGAGRPLRRGRASTSPSGLMFALDVCLSDIAPGEILELSSANAGLVHELPAWCRGTGHELVASEPDGDRTSVPDPPGRRARR